MSAYKKGKLAEDLGSSKAEAQLRIGIFRTCYGKGHLTIECSKRPPVHLEPLGLERAPNPHPCP